MLVHAVFNPRSAGAACLLLGAAGCSAGDNGGAPARSAPPPETVLPMATTAPAEASASAGTASLQPAEPVLRSRLVPGIANATRVGVGFSHACALRGTGEVVCWGDGAKSQLGDGTRTSRAAPAQVPGLSDAVALDVFENYACAVRATGRLVCWGGYVPWPGKGTEDEIPTPREVPGVTDATAVAAHMEHACVLRRSGKVVCFGENDMGRLGDPSAKEGSLLVTVRGVAGATAVFAGNFGGCAIHGKGALTCWGAGSITAWAPSGPGQHLPSPDVALGPTQLKGVSDAVSMSVYGLQACLLHRNGQARCWNIESLNMLPSNPLPEGSLVANLNGATDLGGDLAVRAGGSIAAVWSDGENPYSTHPIVQEITNAVRVTGTDTRGCAVLATGQVACWGDI